MKSFLSCIAIICLAISLMVFTGCGGSQTVPDQKPITPDYNNDNTAISYAISLIQNQYAKDFYVTPNSADIYHHKIDDDFFIQIGAVNWTNYGFNKESGEVHYTVYFAVKENGEWRVTDMNEKSGNLLVNFSSNCYTIEDTFAEKVGKYTIICAGSKYMEENGLTADDLSDSLNSTPILISMDAIGNHEKNSFWGGPCSGQNPIWINLCDQTEYGYFFVIKEMPEDYWFVIGDQKLTAKEIENSIS